MNRTFPYSQSMVNLPENDHVHKVLIISGMHGVGKTSVANIIAEALSMENIMNVMIYDYDKFIRDDERRNVFHFVESILAFQNRNNSISTISVIDNLYKATASDVRFIEQKLQSQRLMVVDEEEDALFFQRGYHILLNEHRKVNLDSLVYQYIYRVLLQ